MKGRQRGRRESLPEASVRSGSLRGLQSAANGGGCWWFPVAAQQGERARHRERK
ncbi:hypothetical protein BVRB_5g112150 [Beta vulgaris subsp. vulgaris]|nr:hypothetical protein BVRB_5g112150 [Beta vulgaris subsp. vulgaris]